MRASSSVLSLVSASLSRQFIFSAISAAILLTAGCASMVPPPLPTLNKPSSGLPEKFKNQFDLKNVFKKTEAPITESTIAETGWEDYYTDPKLKELISIGLHNNLNLKNAVLNIERSAEQYQIRRAALLPLIGIGESTTYSGTKDQSATAYSIGIPSVAYEVDLWGRVRGLKDAALFQYFATGYAKDVIKISLIAQIAQTYAALGCDMAQLNLAKSTLKAQSDSLQLIKKKADVGVISDLPVQQAKISVETAKLAVESYETKIKQDTDLLALLLGQEVPDRLIPTGSFHTITNEAILSFGLPSDLLLNRPDIRQAEAGMMAAGANIRVARAAYFPTISLAGQGGYASASLGNLFKSGSFKYSIGPTIAYAVFDGGARRATFRTTLVDRQMTVNNYLLSIQTAFKEVSDELAVKSNIYQRLETQRRLVDANQKAYDLSSARFKAGVDSYLSVLDSQRTLFVAQQNYLNLLLVAVNNDITIYKVLGGGIKRTENAG